MHRWAGTKRVQQCLWQLVLHKKTSGVQTTGHLAGVAAIQLQFQAAVPMPPHLRYTILCTHSVTCCKRACHANPSHL
jgi:hypothetical protein